MSLPKVLLPLLLLLSMEAGLLSEASTTYPHHLLEGASFPGFSIQENLKFPSSVHHWRVERTKEEDSIESSASESIHRNLTTTFPLLKRKKGGGEEELDAELFPGFSISQSFSEDLSTWSSSSEKKKTQTPQPKPVNPLPAHIPYLFPYLFYGHNFPGFTIQQNLVGLPLPVPIGAPFLPGENKFGFGTGMSRPPRIPARPVGAAASPLPLVETVPKINAKDDGKEEQLQEERPWKDKEDLLKPIKEGNGTDAAGAGATPEKDVDDVEDNAVKPIETIVPSLSTPTLRSEDTEKTSFQINSPEAGKITIIFRNEQDITTDLISFLEQTLGKFKNLSEDALYFSEEAVEPHPSHPQLPQQLPPLSILFNSEINLDPAHLPVLEETMSSGTIAKAKPKPARPSYGIQPGQKVEEATPPLIPNILNLPGWIVPPSKWASFASIIHRKTLGESVPILESFKMRTEEEGCGGIGVSCNSCDAFCNENGLDGGKCVATPEKHSNCICFLEKSRKFGLIFRKSDSSEEPLKEGDGGADLRSSSCSGKCKGEGAYTGFCGGGECFCGIPWRDAEDAEDMPL